MKASSQILFVAIICFSNYIFAQSNFFDANFNNLIGKNSSILFQEQKWKPNNAYKQDKTSHHLEKSIPTIVLYDSMYVWNWDIVSNGWKTASRQINIISDTNNNYLSTLMQKWSGLIWVNDFQYFFVFDNNNNLLSRLSQKWDGTTWKNSTLRNNLYDVNNNQTSNDIKNWNGVSWQNTQQGFYYYDAYNNMIGALSQNWNNSFWVNNELYTSIYDLNNNLTIYNIKTWNGVSWEHNKQESYTYDANGNQTNELYQSWNGVAWDSIYNFAWKYDANHNQISALRQKWISSIRENDFLQNFSYDISNNQTGILSFEWNISAWEKKALVSINYNINNNEIGYLDERWNGFTWLNYLNISNTYDSNSIRQSSVITFWDSTGNVVSRKDSIHLYFHTVASTHEIFDEQNEAIIYPNPAVNNFSILSKTAITIVEIYNVLGVLLHKQLTNSMNAKFIAIDFMDKPRGVYIIKVYTKLGHTSSRKLIIK